MKNARVILRLLRRIFGLFSLAGLAYRDLCPEHEKL